MRSDGSLQEPTFTHEPSHPHPVPGELEHRVQGLLRGLDLEDVEVEPHDPGNTYAVLARRLEIILDLALPVPHRLRALRLGCPWGPVVVCRRYDGRDGPAADALHELCKENVGEAVESLEKAEGHLGKGDGAALLGCNLCFGLQEDSFREGAQKGDVDFLGVGWPVGWMKDSNQLFALGMATRSVSFRIRVKTR